MIPIPLFCAILSASISAVVAFVVTRLTIRANRRQHIENLLIKVVDVSISYPRLEDDAFCAEWVKADKTDLEVMRYDNYCCLVFNLLETVWRYCGGNEEKIEDIVFAREMIFRHRWWWKSQPNNLGGYKLQFHEYVDNVLKGE